MIKLTTEDCALNAADALKTATGALNVDERAGLLGVADMWVRLLDTMTRAGMGRAERADGQAAS